MRRSLVLLLAVFLAACPKKEAAKTASEAAGASACKPNGESVRIALSTLPNTLDWSKSHETSYVNYPVIHAMMRGLTELDAKHAPAPGLAERWEVAGPTYTFHLKKGIVWSDGKTPLTARDFVFGWKRAATVGAEPAEMGDILGGDAILAARDSPGTPEEVRAKVEAAAKNFGVEAVDDLTLEVTLKSPRNYFLARVALVYPFFPAPSHDLEGLSEEQIQRYYNEPANGKPMVVGAFRVEAWDRVAQTIRLGANPFDAEAPKDGLVKQLTLIQADLSPILYEQCKIDFLLMDDPSTLASAPSDLEHTELLSTYFLGMNTSKVSLPLRRAISMALDRGKLTQGLLPSARTAMTYLPPDMPGAFGADDPLGKSFPRFDKEAAKKLLAEANYQGEELTLLVRGSSTFLPELGIADAIRRQLGEVGIKVRPVSTSNFANDVKTQDGTLRHHLFLRRVGSDYAHPQTLFTMFQPTGNHYTDWHKLEGASAEFQKLLDDGAAESDPAKMKELYAKAQELLLVKYAILVPIYFPDRYFRKRPWIDGLGVDPFNFLTLRSMRLKKTP